MRDALAGLLSRRRLVVASALLLALAGFAAWNTMPREEDPQFPERNASIVVPFPGSDAESIARLVTEPIEEHLSEVEEVALVESTSRAGVAVLMVELQSSIYDTDSAWDEVEDAVALARRDFPQGVGAPSLDSTIGDQEAIVLAITGSVDPLRLAEAAERIERVLLREPTVRRVELIADPGEEIVVEYDEETARRLGIDPGLLGLQLGARSTISPGGLVHLGSRSASLRPQTDFASLDELRQTPVTLPSGVALPLSEVARVRRGPAEPPSERMRWNGEPAVGLGIVPRDGIDRVEFGVAVRARLDEVRPSLEPLRIEEVAFQPDQVGRRIGQLEGSLRLGILIVAGILFLAMGPRLGIVVASVVPLVTFAALAIFAAGGGILHQISIAALVIALGMLVDNAIVMAESVQWRIDRGEPPGQAAVASVRELALPLGSATGTTLAAFVPMLMSSGPTADFTRSIPILILLTLTVSYLFAILVTPVLSELLLRPREGRDGPGRLERFGGRVGGTAARRPWLALALLGVLLGISILAAGAVEQRFFPEADRTTLVVDLQMPEGTHLLATDETAFRLERMLEGHPEVVSVASFMGRGAPRFYYNLLQHPSSPHRAQLVVETTRLGAVEEVAGWVRQVAAREFPEAEIVARRLEQGPPIAAPVLVRVVGDDVGALQEGADRVLAVLRDVPGTRDVRHDVGLGVPTVALRIDDAVADRYGIARTDVARALHGRTLGTVVGQFRAGDDPVPIVVRSSQGESYPVADLATLDVAATGGRPVPLAEVAELVPEWRPAAITHRNRARLVSVFAQLAPERTATEVLAELAPRLEALELPPGIRLEIGGELEESGEANAAMLHAAPLGAILLLFFLLAEFNSFRRVGIVLVTVPLAATGVVPGLLISGQPFGFMALLGVVALVGIVVNNAIVLLDVIESRRTEGATVEEALREAVERRTRPILLTTATTVAGLLPLALSEANLWPPMAWAMISGLLASTVLTLVAVPALYRLLFDGWQLPFARRGTAAATAAASLVLALCSAPAVRAEDGTGPSARSPTPRWSLSRVLTGAEERAAAEAAQARVDAASQEATTARRAAWNPTFGMSFDVAGRDRDFVFDTPFGELQLGERTSSSANAELRWALVDVAARRYSVPAARAQARSTASEAERTIHGLRLEAVERFLHAAALEARLDATEAFVESLEARLDETRGRVEAGRSLEAEALRVELDLDVARLDADRLRRSVGSAALALGRAAGAAGPVFPDRHALPSLPVELPDLELLVERAARDRDDVEALREGRRALELRARAVDAEALPRLEAIGQWSSAQGDPFRPQELATASVVMTWSPWANGTRPSRRAAVEARIRELEARESDVLAGLSEELSRSLADLETSRQALGVRQRGIELARETLRVDRERHAAGRATTNDLLAGEARLRDQTTALDLARLEAVRAWSLLAFSVGDEAAWRPLLRAGEVEGS